MSNKKDTTMIPEKQVGQFASKAAGRKAIQKGGEFIAKEAVKRSGRELGKKIATGAANPMFIVGDIAEVGMEKITGSKEAGQATSFAVYVGSGAAVGGPVGAGVAAGCWAIGQCIDAIWN